MHNYIHILTCEKGGSDDRACPDHINTNKYKLSSQYIFYIYL